VSIERIHSLYRVRLLGMDKVESRARRGEKLEERTSGTCKFYLVVHREATGLERVKPACEMKSIERDCTCSRHFQLGGFNFV